MKRKEGRKLLELRHEKGVNEERAVYGGTEHIAPTPNELSTGKKDDDEFYPI